MQSTSQEGATGTANRLWNGVERRRVQKVVETLATLSNRGESLFDVAHDARNMVTALGLYCDLLGEPGVLAAGFTHYADELRLVATASRRLVEKLAALNAGSEAAEGAVAPILQARTCLPAGDSAPRLAGDGGHRAGPLWEGLRRGATSRHAPEGYRRWDLLPALPIANLAAELRANRNLLAALAGPSIELTVETQGGALPVSLTGEDLTRLLVNLVKNAAEAMPHGGRIRLCLRERATGGGVAPYLVLAVEDDGPGIPEDALEKIFASGYTTRAQAASASGWSPIHRGLGLAIVRSIVEAAGGRMTAANRPQGGASFTLEMPVRRARTKDQGLRDQGLRDEGTKKLRTDH